MKAILCPLACLTFLSSVSADHGPDFRFAIAVHSEAPGGGTNGVPMTPDFRTTDEATYRTWRAALLSFAQLCQARGLPWQFQPDWNFLEGVRRFEMPGGAGHNPAIDDETDGKNVVKYLQENLGVNIDPHSHETGGYNYADVAYLIDVALDAQPSLVVGGHVYDPAGPGYQDWPTFTGHPLGLKAKFYAVTSYRWRPVLLMGGGTASHRSDPHISGLWRPQDKDHYFTHSSSQALAAIGNWEQDLLETGRLLTALEGGTVPHGDKLWTAGRVFNHRDLVQPGYLAAQAPALLDTIAAWRDTGRLQVKTYEAIHAEWLAAPFSGNASLYERPVDNMTFSLNWQEFCHTGRSHAELRTLLNLHEALQVPVDVFLTTWQTDILEEEAPELLGRLMSSRFVSLAYHVRAPKPFASNYTWRSVTAADIASYESHRLSLITGQPELGSAGGFAKLAGLNAAAPRLVGPNADTSAASLVHSYFAGAGASMIVQHDSSAAVNFGTMNGALHVRPENFDWRLIEVFNGTSTLDALDEALAAARVSSGSLAPYFVGVKLHDNDLFATQSAWTAIYQDTRRIPNWDPYNQANWAGLLENSDPAEPERRRAIYTGVVSAAASRRGTLNLMDARDTLSMLGSDAPRQIGLTATEVEEELDPGTVIAEISGGGIESGVQCSYALVGGSGSDDNAGFAIAGSSLAVARRLNFEVDPVRTLRIRWTDGGGNSGERALTIVLSNVDADDDDGDGATEAAEILAGTDPLDPNSRLAIQSMEVASGQISFTWRTVAGKSYHLEASTDLAIWHAVPGTGVTAATGQASLSIPFPDASRVFFRIAVGL